MSRMLPLLLTILALIWIAPAFADGMMIPVRPEVPRFSVAYHRVNVTIDHQVGFRSVSHDLLG